MRPVRVDAGGFDAARSRIGFRHVGYAPETIPAARSLARHRHFDAYATIVIEGRYEQAAYAGRMRVEAGDVLIQPTLDGHCDRMLSARVRVQRLPWRFDAGVGGVFRVADIDSVIALATTDVTAASHAVAAAIGSSRARPAIVERSADALAAALLADPMTPIGAWADRMGIAREALTRSFVRTFEVAPARFRAELMARTAWLRAVASTRALCAIATEAGYADQAHMTRAVKRFTGDTPARWRSAAR